MTSQPRRQQLIFSPPWEPQISVNTYKVSVIKQEILWGAFFFFSFHNRYLVENPFPELLELCPPRFASSADVTPFYWRIEVWGPADICSTCSSHFICIVYHLPLYFQFVIVSVFFSLLVLPLGVILSINLAVIWDVSIFCWPCDPATHDDCA
jgi:hypothetical protein